MKSLFILNKPEYLDQCLTAMSGEDRLLLIEDAVTLALHETTAGGFVLHEDLIARGLTADSNQWELVDYPKFVDLTLSFDKTVSWL